ncbi:hypothetical protein MLD38_029868 [Melastoma candidum]|uniref:Uncharacterized protein n=1 Tax=Melastoma candidum TaxID=119954 RepID=A0ACB9N653_9MYRT|nr:hypothetical protein MLD38_029868 [Melastoma candidum]
MNPAAPGSISHPLVSKVRVVARVRPFLASEIAAKDGNPIPCVSVVDQDGPSTDEVMVHIKDHYTRNECYKLDSFYGEEDDNVRNIFEREVKPLISGVLQGSNATVFAYGATGSGKTYTMQGTNKLPGLMPLAMANILSECDKAHATIEISYYEIYLERCYDLLELKLKEIAILDDQDGQIHLKGLVRVPVRSMSEFNEVFSNGIQRRRVAHTGLNDVSSRSHGVLVISVLTPCNDGDAATVVGKLNLIDLAGNEDNRKTGNEGVRLLESGKINQSLFTLSNVIYALNNNMPRVPYRESKLTRILQDSLGGTSSALMVACLNPGEYQEAVHTVGLAARSRHIPNFVSPARRQETPKLRVDMEAKLRSWLESRGKTKSRQRFGALSTPVSTKKNVGCASSATSKTGHKRGDFLPRRILCAPQSDQRILDDSEVLFSEAKEGGLETSLADLSLDSGTTAEQQSTKDDTAATMCGSPIGSLTPRESYNTTTPNKNRTALSTININVDKAVYDHLVETQTPMSLKEDNSQMSEYTRTPLDKFNNCSTTLKNHLTKQYLELLNAASREELLVLKGIGPKRADYILQLRQAGPICSLDDLEKIGLSSRQVHNLFNWAVREALE